MATPLPSDRPVRFGVVATGSISAKLAGEIAATEGAEVVAVGSRTQESADRFAAEHGIARAHGSHEALIADDGVDVLYIGATHDAHRPIAAAAIEAGKAVLCEKPLTVTAAQAQELVDLARARDVFLMEAMWTRCQPAFRRLHEMVREGAIGELRQVRSSIGFPMAHDPAHRLFDPERAGGALLDMLVYPVTAAVTGLGEPTEVKALGNVAHGVDLSTVLVARWANGATAALTATTEAQVDVTTVYSGSTGRIDVPAPWHRCEGFTVVTGHGADEAAEVVSMPAQGAGYVPMIAEVVRCLRAGETESPMVPLDDTLAVMRVLDRGLAEIGLTYPDAAHR